MNKKKLLTIAVSLAFVFSVSMPISSTQAASTPFGGMVVFPIYCTCSQNFWIFFTPLWIGNTPTPGPLVYTPGGTTLYANYMIATPGAWHLGAFTSNPSSCEFYIAYSCMIIPSYGTIDYTGTS